MKNRVKKRLFYARIQCSVLLPKRFAKDILRGLAEAEAGKLTQFKRRPGALKGKIRIADDFDAPYSLTAEDRDWLDIAPVGREFGSPDYERLAQRDALRKNRRFE